jgi:PAS domain S-box-containing protein
MTFARDEHVPDVLQRLRDILQTVATDTSSFAHSHDIPVLLSELQELTAQFADQQERLKQMQQEMVQARSQYASLYHSTPVGIITLDSSMRMTGVNRAAVLMLNYPREQVLRQDVRSFIHTDDRDSFFQHRNLLHTTRTPQECELRMLRADGTPLFLQIDVLLHQSTHASDHYLLFLRDISLQKRYAAQQQEYELRLWQLTKHSPHVLWLHDVKNQQIVAITPSYATIWQESVDQVFTELASFLKAVHPQDTERVTAAFHRQKQTGGYDEEYRIVDNDGAIRWMHTRTFPVYNDQGKLYRIAGVAEDITTRKQAQEERDMLRQQVQGACIAAEQAARRMEILLRMTERFSQVTAPAQIAGLLLEEIAIQSGVTVAVVFLLNEERTALQQVSSSSVASNDPSAPLSHIVPDIAILQQSKGEEAPDTAEHTIPLSLHTPGTAVVQSGQPRWAGTHAALLDDFPLVQPVTRNSGAWATLPLLMQRDVIGVLLLAYAETHTFDENERTFLSVLARQCAQALQNIQSQHKASVARLHIETLTQKVRDFQQQNPSDEAAAAERIRVLLVDDHALLRAGMHALLTSIPGMEVSGEADNGELALRMLTREQPDIVITDMTLGNSSSIPLIQQITEQFPTVRVIVLSDYTHAEYVLQALQAGADGYLVKHAQTHDLHTAIESVLRNDTYLSPQISRHVVEGYQGRVGTTTLKDVLSPRQQEVVRLLANGGTTHAIANQLNISVKTVEAHRTQAMKRLGIKDIAGLVRYAIRMGWSTPQ